MRAGRRVKKPYLRLSGGKAPTRIENKYFSKVVGKAVDILQALKGCSQPLSLNDLTQRVGMVKSSVFRILYTLEVSGYICRNDLGLYSLSNDMRQHVPAYMLSRLPDIANPRMKDLNHTFKETVSLAVLLGNHIEVFAVMESPHLLRMGNVVGRILPPHASSLGKSISAFQPEDRSEKLLLSYGLHRFTDNTITDQVELKREFERIRARGYSTDNEESVTDGFCFGAPISAENEQCIAAISISLPKTRMKPGTLQEKNLVVALKHAAEDISGAIHPAGTSLHLR